MCIKVRTIHILPLYNVIALYKNYKRLIKKVCQRKKDNKNVTIEQQSRQPLSRNQLQIYHL